MRSQSKSVLLPTGGYSSPRPSPNSRAIPPSDRLVAQAEATLGWKIHNPSRFLANCADLCLGEALNLEHDYLDELLPSPRGGTVCNP
jgi:hypothetical protein